MDASFWIGRALPRDSRYQTARAMEDIVRREQLVTTELVLGEVWTILRRRLGHLATHGAIDAIRALSAIRIEPVDPTLVANAWAWLRVRDERPYSFVDATSFALMRKLRIREALAFDGDFAAAGFVELRP
ncbi:MAG: PIN domain-containing protein [Actinomycetota bacterium]